ncbi:MAG: VWA domain-containing protein [Blastocatellia bacterium]|nr:VWA domain-containing protein [Blastocatellia bacterium]
MRLYLFLLAVLCTLPFIIYSQPTLTDTFAIKPGQAVYTVVVKGDCGVQGDLTFVNGQAVLVPKPGGSYPLRKQQKMLTRSARLTEAEEVLKQMFAQDKTFVVVDALENADFVFYVCSSYTEELLPKLLIQRKQLASQLVVAQAQIVPASVYRKYVASGEDALTAVMWNALTPNPYRPLKRDKKKTADNKKNNNARTEPPQPSQEIRWDGPTYPTDPFEVQVQAPSLEDLVKYFLKDFAKIKPVKLSEFASSLAATEPIRPAPDDVSQEKRRPTLVNKQETQEAADKAETKSADNTEEVIKIDTALIYVPVRVMDKDGKYIPDLQAKDFKLYEDGVEQDIEHFSAVDDPFNVVLMLDMSGSTRFKVEDIQDAAVTFTEQLRPQDRVMVVSFDQKVWVDSEFTNDRTKLMKAILRTRTGTSTSVYDALDLVLTERINQIQGRKAIVLFSDGVDTSSHLATLQSTIERMEESNSILYSVHYDTEEVVVQARTIVPNAIVAGSTKEDYQRAEKYMQELANRSGGRFYEAATLGDAKEAFASIAEELRRQYGLGYYSKNDKRDGAFRKIRVQGANTNWAVRSRVGYRAPKK